MMPTFDPTKPVQTRDGRKARILCTDRKSDAFPIIALVMDEDGEEEEYASYTAAGMFHSEGGPEEDLDLLNVPDRAETFRTFRWTCPHGLDMPALCLGGWPARSEDDARSLADDWDGVAKLVTEDGRLVSLEVIPAT